MIIKQKYFYLTNNLLLAHLLQLVILMEMEMKIFMLEEQKVKQDKFIFKILKEDLFYLDKIHSLMTRFLKILVPYFLMLIVMEI